MVSIRSAILNTAYSNDDLVIYLQEGTTYTITNDFDITTGSKNVTIIGNGAIIDGGNYYRFAKLSNGGLRLNITNVTFSNCGRYIPSYSGGVFLGQQKHILLISNCTFINSTARNGGVFYNNAIDSENKRPFIILNDTKFINSYAENHAGVGDLKYTGLTIDNCQFVNTTSRNIGGTFFMNSGNLTVINSSF